ncbi:hypothetical protein AB990_20900 [Alkalihalobacillus pseudalcaliphilus]|nr:hypothetical protein AB990_20900 [Alkalihalobacillus pseudalcaliphilus]
MQWSRKKSTQCGVNQNTRQWSKEKSAQCGAYWKYVPQMLHTNWLQYTQNRHVNKFSDEAYKKP